jgi:mevalonate kinase
MKNEIYLEIPGRICILGDKVDLLEKPVIAMAINLMMKFNYRSRSDDRIEFFSNDTNERINFKLQDSPPKNIDLAYWSVLFERLRNRISHGFSLEVESDIPIGGGLSTSAAVSVGFLKIMNQAFSLNLSNNEIAELAYLGENKDLGIQCGRMDQYSVAHGGITFIHTGDNPEVEQLDVEYLPIVVGDSMEERKAVSVLNRIKKKIKDKDAKTLEAFKVVENGVYQGKEALLTRDFKKLGELMDMQQKQEIKLGAATDKILKLCAVAKDAGALGAKQMGAGGGGCMLAIAPGKENEVAHAIEKAGGRTWIFDIYKY